MNVNAKPPLSSNNKKKAVTLTSHRIKKEIRKHR
jgi:hypothetical protein